MAWLFHIGSAYTIPVASFLFGLYLMDNVLSVRSAIQLSHRLDDLQKVRQEIRSHLEEKAAQLQQKYEGRLEEVTDRFMAGLEDANDDFLKEKELYLAQLRSGEDLFERRLLRSHPDLRSKRHSRKLLNLLREQFNLRMQAASGQLQQSHLLKQVRRDVARVKTLLNEKAGA